MHNVVKKTAVPLYRQVMLRIKDDIAKGILSPGSQLPIEPELALKYKVSRITIRRVLQMLSNEGLVARRKGKGTFITDPGRDKLPLALGIISFSDVFLESNEYDSNILKGITMELDANIPLTTVYWRKGMESSRLKNEFKGLFLLHPTEKFDQEVRNILTENIPVVFVSSTPNKKYKNPKVSVDNYSGAKEAMEYLVKKGRRQIAFISGSVRKSSVAERFKAYKDVLKKNRIPYDKSLVLHMDNSDEKCGFDATRLLLDQAKQPDAIFSCTDLMALGAMRAVKDNDISIPDDISIIGFDNSAIAPYLDPPLTTVNSDTEAIGRKAVEQLLNLLDGKNIETNIVIPSELIIRDSA